EPTFRVIGGSKPEGLCGSGLISLLAEMFLTGVVDKGGKVNTKLPTSRTRDGAHGGEYVVAWAAESSAGEDIVITNVDIDNLLRAKAAIYAGFAVLAENVGVTLDMAEKVLVGGSFGKYINVEKAIEIGLLPDLPWERFQFLGNTSVQGSYLALIDYEARNRITEIAARMTYIELSADNKFYDAFMSALFLPHTDMSLFPSVAKMMEEK
ncbi:MAG: ferredoxin, partial [Anaerolinea sp. 4484_236]